jgi:hypothetical protein
VEPLAEAGLVLPQILELIINKYGAIFILLLISGMALISLLKKILSRTRNPEPVEFIYAITFLIAILIGTAMLFGNFIERDPIRVTRFSLLMATILSGLVIYDFIEGHPESNPADKERPTRRSALIIAAGIVIVAMAALSMGSAYNSPRTSLANSQVTWREIAYTKWFGKLKSPDILVVVNLTQAIHRFEDYNFGVDSSSTSKSRIDLYRLPSHFGYEQNDSVAEALGFRDRYLIASQLDKVAPLYFPENVRPKAYQWTEEDFTRLRSDPTAAHIYANGEFEIWRVYGE